MNKNIKFTAKRFNSSNVFKASPIRNLSRRLAHKIGISKIKQGQAFKPKVRVIGDNGSLSLFKIFDSK